MMKTITHSNDDRRQVVSTQEQSHYEGGNQLLSDLQSGFVTVQLSVSDGEFASIVPEQLTLTERVDVAPLDEELSDGTKREGLAVVGYTIELPSAPTDKTINSITLRCANDSHYQADIVSWEYTDDSGGATTVELDTEVFQAV